MNIRDPFNFDEKVAVITGGAGTLCSAIALALAECGSKIVILDKNLSSAEKLVHEIMSLGFSAKAIETNVIDRESLVKSRKTIVDSYGRVDFLINGVGGNISEATTNETNRFFDIPESAIRDVINLNFIGTFLSSQIFGEVMVEYNKGIIINIASMAGIRPLTRTVGYSAAKAAIINFTQWLAIHMSENYSSQIRVNALAPGFFMTEQNKYLLINEAGELTERSKKILAHTPMQRFGSPEDLVLTTLWLLSDGASFVNGVTIPVDGGFSVYSGV